MGVTVANDIIAHALREQSAAGIVDTTFKNNEVLGRFQIRPLTGGATLNRKMRYGSNSSVGTYSEGDAVGVSGQQSYITAQHPVQYYKATVSFTGHARDQLKNGSPQAAFFDQLGEEFTEVMKDLVDKVSTDALGTSTTAPVGILGAIDSTGTYAGLARATYAWFAAYEVAGTGGTVTLADLNSADMFSSDAEYAASTNEIWASWKQRNKIQGAMVLMGQANSPMRLMGGDQLRVPGVNDTLVYNGKPVIPIRDLNNEVILGVTTSDLYLNVQRNWQVDQLGKVDDSDKFLLTGAFGICVDNPKKHWKITGYTA